MRIDLHMENLEPRWAFLTIVERHHIFLSYNSSGYTQANN